MGIASGDELWAARYILEVTHKFSLYICLEGSNMMLFLLCFIGVKNSVFCFQQRITEIAGVVVSFDPKPIPVSFFMAFHLICVEMYFILICSFIREIGMALELTPTTGRKRNY